jgi:F-type H+-transporting ATPase subunit a
MSALLLPFHAGLLAANISVGEHPTAKLGPFTVNLDTIWATGVAMLVVFALGFAVRRQVTTHVPGRLQLVYESGLELVTRQVEGTIGPRGLYIIPLVITLFVFILVCNFFEIFGLGARYEFLLTPTADVNLTLALALIVFFGTHYASIRARGFGGYVAHYFSQPFPKALFLFNGFINLVEEIAKPITLALRLFGNLFSGALMLSLIAALGAWKLGAIPIGNIVTLLLSVVWKLFDVFIIGPIQAFIFALLTLLYYDTAMSTTGH